MTEYGIPDEYIYEHYSFVAWGRREALRARNARARELRREGFTVVCQTWNFEDLLRDTVASLEAWKGKRALFQGTSTRVAPPAEVPA
jgi:hypothetical protein